MVAISQELSILNKPSNLCGTNDTIIHSVCEFLNDWAIKFNNRYDFFVKLNALIIFPINPFLPSLPLQLAK